MIKKSINKIVASHPNPTTYVFLDTCAILDVLRLPVKYEHIFNMLSEYKALIDKVRNGDVTLVTSCITYVELQSNKKNAQEAEVNWENIITKNLHFYEGFARVAGLVSGNEMTVIYDTVDLLTYLDSMYNNLTQNILYIPEKLQYDKFAMDRVANRIPPAMGKTEYKDCFIWNTCMDLARSVKPNDRIFFFTTNKKDFVVNPRGTYGNQFQRDASNVKIFVDITAMMLEI